MPQQTSKPRSLAWRIALTVFAFNALYATTYLGNPMSKSILDLTVSLVDRGSLNIDPYAGNSTDIAKRDGHYYSGMPPGVSVVCVPYYLIAKTWLWLVVTPDRERTVDRKFFDADAAWRKSEKHLTIVLLNLFICIFGCSVMAGVMAVWFHSALGLLYPSLEPKRRLVTTWLFSFATLWFIYSPGIYHRTFSTFLCFGAFLLVILPDKRRPALQWRGLLFGGALGLAGASSYEIAIVAALLAVFAAVTRGLRWPWGWTLAGGALFAVLLAAYHTACFGAPWATPYGARISESVVPPMYQGDRAVAISQARRAFEFFAGSRYGLFFYSPLLLLAIPGLWRARRDDALRGVATFALAVGIALLAFHFATGYDGLPGEYGFRMMIPAIPFLMLLLPATYAWSYRAVVPILTGASAFVLAKGVMYGVHAGRPFWENWPDFIGRYGFSNYTLANLKDHAWQDLFPWLTLSPWLISIVHLAALAFVAFAVYRAWCERNSSET